MSLLVMLSGAPAADAWLATAVALGVDPASNLAPDPTDPNAVQAAAARSAMVAAAQAQLAGVAAQQDALASSLAQMGATELYRAQRLYNAIAVRIPANNVEALRTLPGVVDVRYLMPKAPAQAQSVPFLGIPAIWQGAVGGPLKGNGVQIGVIDTGADYLHVTFGGPGTGYDVNNTAIIGDVDGFPGVKIVGGFDFAGDNYNADPGDSTFQPVPRPDPDPADCFGHGTHVSGTIAGYGVDNDGGTFGGPFNGSTPFSSMIIGPGVAPEAELLALKVFGCDGTSEIVDVAIEWAVDPDGDGDFSDRLDVINMSLGSPLGSPLDSTSIASNKAAELGVFVVTSAGNSS
ncbi:MAG: S8 family serine peptidase, partial [Caldilineaceae bacterium]